MINNALLKSINFLLISLHFKNWVILKPKDNRVNFTDSKSIRGRINEEVQIRWFGINQLNIF